MCVFTNMEMNMVGETEGDHLAWKSELCSLTCLHPVCVFIIGAVASHGTLVPRPRQLVSGNKPGKFYPEGLQTTARNVKFIVVSLGKAKDVNPEVPAMLREAK